VVLLGEEGLLVLPARIGRRRRDVGGRQRALLVVLVATLVVVMMVVGVVVVVVVTGVACASVGPLPLEVLFEAGKQLCFEARGRQAALLQLHPQSCATPVEVLVCTDVHSFFLS
jgi:hypothetical protein